MVGFERPLYIVGEEDGQVELCVNITMPKRQDIGTINFSLTVETQDGSAGISCSKSQNSVYFNWIGCGGIYTIMYLSIPVCDV